MIAAGHQRCSRRRTERRDVEVRVAEAGTREFVYRGRRNLGSIAAEIRPSGVIEDDEQYIRRMWYFA